MYSIVVRQPYTLQSVPPNISSNIPLVLPGYIVQGNTKFFEFQYLTLHS